VIHYFNARLIAVAVIGGVVVGCVSLLVQPAVAARASTPPAVEPARLEAHVKKLSVALYPRSADQFDNLENAAQYVMAQLKASGAVVSVQEVRVQEARYKNIIARYGPEQGPLLVIGAHYDSHGDASGERVTPDTHTPGADDNASGVAGLLELAQLLGRNSPKRPVELVAYTLEEPPHYRSEHMGSVWHARSLVAAKRDVELMLSLEMIGYFSDAPDSQRYLIPSMKHLYSDRGDFIALVGKFSDFGNSRRAKAIMAGATDLPVYSINAPRALQGVDFSDHRSYWNAGIPAMMITDTAFLRNPNYHRAGDTWDKLDYQRMAKVVQGVYAITQHY
jgi:Zn-dependent M28 family amino/carboxypeptidase